MFNTIQITTMNYPPYPAIDEPPFGDDDTALMPAILRPDHVAPDGDEVAFGYEDEGLDESEAA